MIAICPGSAWWPLPAERTADGKSATCPKCGATVALSKSRHLFAHPAPVGMTP